MRDRQRNAGERHTNLPARAARLDEYIIELDRRPAVSLELGRSLGVAAEYATQCMSQFVHCSDSSPPVVPRRGRFSRRSVAALV